MKTLPPPIIAAKNRIVSQNAWVWLLKIELNPTQNLFFTDDAINITYDGDEYHRYPFLVGDQRMSDDINPMTVSIDNITQDIARSIRENNDLRGATFRLYHANNGVIAETIRLKVTEPIVTDQVAVFTLGYDDLYKIRIPGRRIHRTRCQNTYGGEICGFDKSTPGAPQTCDFSIFGENGCIFHAEFERANDIETTRPSQAFVAPGVPRGPV